MGEYQEINLNTSHAFAFQELNDVTLLITHYNRSKSLEQLLTNLHSLDICFNSIVVSDDCSSSEHLKYLQVLQKQYHFKLCTTPINKGLGNNINKGQDLIKTPYTLYIQEDFTPSKEFKKRLLTAVDLLYANQEYDMVRFYAYNKYPYLIPHINGFSKMVFKWWYPGLGKFAYYSDHPHLRRTSFFSKFGKYKEGISGDQTEFSMMLSFIQNKGKAFFYEEFQSLLFQANSTAEPSTMKRDFWRNSNNFFVKMLRVLFRYSKFYISYFFINHRSKS